MGCTTLGSGCCFQSGAAAIIFLAAVFLEETVACLWSGVTVEVLPMDVFVVLQLASNVR